VGILHLANEIGPQDRPPRAPSQETRIHERVQYVAAVIRANIPQTHCLSEGQLKARHFFEVAPNTVDDHREIHSAFLLAASRVQPLGQANASRVARICTVI
jgi:hypothetical protein